MGRVNELFHYHIRRGQISEHNIPDQISDMPAMERIPKYAGQLSNPKNKPWKLLTPKTPSTPIYHLFTIFGEKILPPDRRPNRLASPHKPVLIFPSRGVLYCNHG